MPCYEVRTISVEFRAENRDVLDAAIKQLGWGAIRAFADRVTLPGISLDLEAGRAEVQEGFQGRLNELKRAYATEAVRAAAKKVRWSCKQQGQKLTVNKIAW